MCLKRCSRWCVAFYSAKACCLFTVVFICSQVFPKAQAALDAVKARNADASVARSEKDFGAQNFLECLIWLKTVFLQDAAVLYSKYSTSCSIYKGAVFQHAEWMPFVERVRMHVARCIHWA